MKPSHFHFFFFCCFFSLIFEFDMNVIYRISHHIELFEGWEPSGLRVKAGLLFIPFNGSQPSVPPVRRRLINTGSGGHLHVLHENIQPGTVSTQAQQRGDWVSGRIIEGLLVKNVSSPWENTPLTLCCSVERDLVVWGFCAYLLSCWWSTDVRLVGLKQFMFSNSVKLLKTRVLSPAGLY